MITAKQSFARANFGHSQIALWKTKPHCGSLLVRMRLSRPNPDKSIREGEVTERLKVHDWKSCVLQKSTGGSNPPLSATPDGARDGSRSLA
jgi:hypothetical protein